MSDQSVQRASKSEDQLESELVSQLVEQGWNAVEVHNDERLNQNFREQFNKINQRVLDYPLTDDEFKDILNQIAYKDVFDSANFLRKDRPFIHRGSRRINCDLFKKEWKDNIFQVTRQVSSKGNRHNNRYDIVLLINGLPMVQIELKKSGTDLKKAFDQIASYQKQGSYTGLFNFIQFFIISNDGITRYFANQDDPLNYAFTFDWTNETNEPYSRLEDFAQIFIQREWVVKMIHRYMVVQADRRVIIMRPYQVHGTKCMVDAALKTNKDGFIWHTTGSGKTLTSFKVSQLLANGHKFKQVFFVVDRLDLNIQTIKEFNQYQTDSVEDTENAKKLVAKIESHLLHGASNLIVTTMQKLDSALNNSSYDDVLDKLKNEKVAFVIDECHRSQYGTMNANIRSKFPNAQFFGFTGTPLFATNSSDSGTTTADVFGECLHKYLLKDAIKDENTLPFSVAYVNTISMREEIEDPNYKAKVLNKEEVWNSPIRIQKVVKDIIADRARKSDGRNFNAMLTVDSVKAVTLYMEAFQQAQKSLNEKDRLTIATVFTPSENADLESEEPSTIEYLKDYIAEYNKEFDSAFSGETSSRSKYNEDVARRFKEGEIDILIVVSMMLTGFDSRRLNTLYVDKKLENHSLIQAYSRTNRIYGTTKKLGYIRCYRYLKEETNAAVKLFSQLPDDKSLFTEKTLRPYGVLLNEFEIDLEVFLKNYPDPTRIDSTGSEATRKEFVLNFRNLAKKLRQIETSSEFNLRNIGITPDDFKGYESYYHDLSFKVNRGDESVSFLNDVDFQIEEIITDLINVDYIHKLLAELNSQDEETRKAIINKIEIESSDNLQKKSELLIRFLRNEVPLLPNEANVADAYSAFVEKEISRQLTARASEFGIPSLPLFKAILTAFMDGKSSKMTTTFLDGSQLPREERLSKRKELKPFMKSLAEHYETK